jgi:hypothetical protein
VALVVVTLRSGVWGACRKETTDATRSMSSNGLMGPS